MLTEELIEQRVETEGDAPLSITFEKRAAEIADITMIQLTAQIRAQVELEMASCSAPSPVPHESQTVQPELLAEIKAAEDRLNQNQAATEANMASEPFNLGLSLKLKEEKLELTSYLKGLYFHATKASDRS